MKVVINEDYGGFGLSYAGMLHYALLKGIELYPEQGEFGHWTFWTVPADKRPKGVEPAEWHAMPIEDRLAHNDEWGKSRLSNSEIPRDDPALVQTVEELGKTAWGRFACLKIVDIPDGIDWEIDEYDGKEWVAETHQTWS